MKGVAAAWLIGLSTIFLFSLLYIMFTQIYVTNYFPEVENAVDEAPLNETYKENVKETLTNIKNIWLIFPFIFLIGIIVWMFISAQKKEPVYVGY